MVPYHHSATEAEGAKNTKNSYLNAHRGLNFMKMTTGYASIVFISSLSYWIKSNYTVRIKCHEGDRRRVRIVLNFIPYTNSVSKADPASHSTCNTSRPCATYQAIARLKHIHACGTRSNAMCRRRQDYRSKRPLQLVTSVKVRGPKLLIYLSRPKPSYSPIDESKFSVPECTPPLTSHASRESG